jgi:hypothetical protein
MSDSIATQTLQKVVVVSSPSTKKKCFCSLFHADAMSVPDQSPSESASVILAAAVAGSFQARAMSPRLGLLDSIGVVGGSGSGVAAALLQHLLGVGLQ